MLTVLASVSSAALTLSTNTGAVVVAVRHLALVVSDGALSPLPARVAPAGPFLILSIVAAEDRTGAETAVLAIIPRSTLT